MAAAAGPAKMQAVQTFPNFLPHHTVIDGRLRANSSPHVRRGRALCSLPFHARGVWFSGCLCANWRLACGLDCVSKLKSSSHRCRADATDHYHSAHSTVLLIRPAAGARALLIQPPISQQGSVCHRFAPTSARRLWHVAARSSRAVPERRHRALPSPARHRLLHLAHFPEIIELSRVSVKSQVK